MSFWHILGHFWDILALFHGEKHVGRSPSVRLPVNPLPVDTLNNLQAGVLSPKSWR